MHACTHASNYHSNAAVPGPASPAMTGAALPPRSSSPFKTTDHFGPSAPPQPCSASCSHALLSPSPSSRADPSATSRAPASKRRQPQCFTSIPGSVRLSYLQNHAEAPQKDRINRPSFVGNLKCCTCSSPRSYSPLDASPI